MATIGDELSSGRGGGTNGDWLIVSSGHASQGVSTDDSVAGLRSGVLATSNIIVQLNTNHPTRLSSDGLIRRRSCDLVKNDDGHGTIELGGILEGSLAPTCFHRRGLLRLVAIPQEIR